MEHAWNPPPKYIPPPPPTTTTNDHHEDAAMLMSNGLLLNPWQLFNYPFIMSQSHHYDGNMAANGDTNTLVMDEMDESCNIIKNYNHPLTTPSDDANGFLLAMNGRPMAADEEVVMAMINGNDEGTRMIGPMANNSNSNSNSNLGLNPEEEEHHPHPQHPVGVGGLLMMMDYSCQCDDARILMSSSKCSNLGGGAAQHVNDHHHHHHDGHDEKAAAAAANPHVMKRRRRSQCRNSNSNYRNSNSSSSNNSKEKEEAIAMSMSMAMAMGQRQRRRRGGSSVSASASASASSSSASPPSSSEKEMVVHVRARRGEATDSHSVSERLRRERINKRMKLLQELIPNCENLGKAAILEEIINYVKSLQQQIEFLSMKLAATSPTNIIRELQSDQNWIYFVEPRGTLGKIENPCMT